jgi:phosphatidylserine/phosphatidylglycerophosphate/cardiolipin synthase-like enzyme
MTATVWVAFAGRVEQSVSGSRRPAWPWAALRADATARCAWFARLAVLALVLALVLGATGCASLPPPAPDRAMQQALPAAPDGVLPQAAARALSHAQPAGPSALLSLAHPALALDARLTLIAQAQQSLDLQYYHLADDGTGRRVLRALRDAARRGVRVRLLLDDFYTAGMDPLLQALAAQPNVQLRLFNPFYGGRSTTLGRWLALAGDFRRLNHRMHNKLFIANGALAVVGGRNLADGYFQRSDEANFIDFDALVTGAAVPDLAAVFDRFWNSPVVRDLADVLAPLAGEAEATAQRREFEVLTAVAEAGGEARTAPQPASASFATLLTNGLPGMVGSVAEVTADAPEKLSRAVGDSLAETATYRAIQVFHEARQELMLFSPYFIPGEPGMAGLREARAHGVAVRIITNALSATDEPLASLAYERYRVPMLQLGVELYEVSGTTTQRDERLRAVFGPSRAQLHTKLAVVDRRTLLIGSLNLDQRSATTNTELALVVRSPELTRQVLTWFNSSERRDVRGSYQVRLTPEGRLQWVALLGEGRTEVHDSEPEADPLRRFRLWLISLLVPESLL